MQLESSKVIVIFDVDGTINQTEVYAVKAYRKALEEVGKTGFSDKEFIERIGAPFEQDVRYFFGENQSEQVEMFKTLIHKYWIDGMKESAKTFEGIHQMLEELKEKGYNVFATGEMGIGNTTTSSAVCSVLLDQSVEKVTGKGAGLTNKDLEHKIEVIKQSIALNQVDANDPLDVLSKVGGLDIAGMVGCYIGGAALQVPVFIDGFISSVAALIAIRLVPECAPYLFPSHCSNEPAGHLILDAIGKEPYILANMCLGEGTGAVMGFTIADYAFKAYWELPSFEQTNFGTYEELN